MNETTSAEQLIPSHDNYSSLLAKYRKPCHWRCSAQLATTVIPYVLTWIVMWYTLPISYGLTLLLAVLQAGFTIRLFVIHHDCGHGSYFKWRRLNDFVGFIFGTLTLTPYRSWQWSHAWHHATSGNLDRRGHGDVLTLTVNEYKNLSPMRRLGYRIFRNPLVLFGIIPWFLFVIAYRFPNTRQRHGAQGWSGVLPTNLALLVAVTGLCWWLGWREFLLLFAPVLLLSTTAGIWLFYVQHQFEDSYWEEGKAWDRTAASMHGASYYALPRVLEWFTAHIGYHHIHHLDSRIPNYRLRECFRNEKPLQQVRRLTIRQSITCIFSKLWDEHERRMVGFPARA